MGRLSMYTSNNTIKHHYHQQQKITISFIITGYYIFWIQLYEKHIDYQNGFATHNSYYFDFHILAMLSYYLVRCYTNYTTGCCDYKNINNVVGWYGEGGSIVTAKVRLGAGAVAGGSTQGSASQVSATTSLLLPPLPPTISLILYLRQKRPVLRSGILTVQIIE